MGGGGEARVGDGINLDGVVVAFEAHKGLPQPQVRLPPSPLHLHAPASPAHQGMRPRESPQEEPFCHCHTPLHRPNEPVRYNTFTPA